MIRPTHSDAPVTLAYEHARAEVRWAFDILGVHDFLGIAHEEVRKLANLDKRYEPMASQLLKLWVAAIDLKPKT